MNELIIVCEAIHSRCSLFRFILFLSGRHCVREARRFFLFLPRDDDSEYFYRHFSSHGKHTTEMWKRWRERREIKSTADIFIYIFRFLWYFNTFCFFEVFLSIFCFCLFVVDGLERDEMVSMDRTAEYYISMRILHVQSRY